MVMAFLMLIGVVQPEPIVSKAYVESTYVVSVVTNDARFEWWATGGKCYRYRYSADRAQIQIQRMSSCEVN